MVLYIHNILVIVNESGEVEDRKIQCVQLGGQCLQLETSKESYGLFMIYYFTNSNNSYLSCIITSPVRFRHN